MSEYVEEDISFESDVNESSEMLPAFQDPEFSLLSDYDRRQKISILNIRRRTGCSISEAIKKFKSRKLKRSFKKKKYKIRTRRNSHEGNGSVITSLAGKTSSRNWKTIK